METSSTARTIAEAEAQSLTMPACFDDWWEFAHLLDGYSIAQEMGFEHCSVLFQQLRERYGQAGRWSGTALELRCALFFYARSLRFVSYDKDMEYFNVVDGLMAAIAEQLGLPYQSDADAQRHCQEKTDALTRMSPDERLADMGIRIVRPTDASDTRGDE